MTPSFRTVDGAWAAGSFALLTLVAAATARGAAGFQEGNNQQDRLVAEIAELGGYAGVTEAARGKPVNWLVLEGRHFGDSELRRYAQAFPKLMTVGISSTTVTDAGLSAVSLCRHLRSLTIESPSVDGSFLTALADMPRLWSLRMRCPRMNAAALKNLAAIPELRWLTLEYPNLKDADLSQLKGSRIETLKLSGGRFSGSALTALADLPNLHELRIDGIELQNNEAPALHGFEHLGVMVLAGAHITDGGVKPLTGLRGLRQLELVDASVTGTGLEVLKQAIPNAQITLRQSKPGER